MLVTATERKINSICLSYSLGTSSIFPGDHDLLYLIGMLVASHGTPMILLFVPNSKSLAWLRKRSD